jgi:hypothetical protein
MKSKDNASLSLVKQRMTCDAEDCNASGTVELKIPAGKFGIVTLFVCKNCVGKFRD